jgi:hypothetical protein
MATIALTSSTVYGQAITFVANVDVGITPGGTVTFLDAGTVLATVDGSGFATRVTSGLGLGPLDHSDLWRRRGLSNEHVDGTQDVEEGAALKRRQATRVNSTSRP